MLIDMHFVLEVLQALAVVVSIAQSSIGVLGEVRKKEPVGNRILRTRTLGVVRSTVKKGRAPLVHLYFTQPPLRLSTQFVPRIWSFARLNTVAPPG